MRKSYLFCLQRLVFLVLLWATTVTYASTMSRATTTTAGFTTLAKPLSARISGRGESDGLYTRSLRQMLSPSLWSARSRRPKTRGGVVSMALPGRYKVASVGLFAAGMIFGSFISGGVSSKIRLYRTVPDIPNVMFQDNASISGTVISVSDGDSIRVRHKPTIPLPLPGRKMEGKRTEQTLQIRLYAVDCPEVSHFGNPAQPLSAEAKQFTRDALEGKDVKVKLLRLDQYQRAVCKVQYGRWPFRKDVSAELLKEGLGVLYRQGGAEYDDQEQKLSQIEARAKEDKLGVWKKVGGETPSQYKARIKRGQPAGP